MQIPLLRLGRERRPANLVRLELLEDVSARAAYDTDGLFRLHLAV
jgi:hypothetical protein